jgi:predicted acylesterase/phospholipase RssA
MVASDLELKVFTSKPILGRDKYEILMPLGSTIRLACRSSACHPVYFNLAQDDSRGSRNGKLFQSREFKLLVRYFMDGGVFANFPLLALRDLARSFGANKKGKVLAFDYVVSIGTGLNSSNSS